MLPCRVYESFNPHAEIIWGVVEEVFQIPSIDVAMELEKTCKVMGFL